MLNVKKAIEGLSSGLSAIVDRRVLLASFLVVTACDSANESEMERDDAIFCQDSSSNESLHLEIKVYPKKDGIVHPNDLSFECDYLDAGEDDRRKYFLSCLRGTVGYDVVWDYRVEVEKVGEYECKHREVISNDEFYPYDLVDQDGEGDSVKGVVQNEDGSVPVEFFIVEH